MPYLKIKTNAEISNSQDFLKQASSLLASQLAKPENYVMIEFEHNPNMMFAGSSEALAYLELKSLGLDSDHTTALSAALCQFLHDQANISASRIYIEFAGPQRSMWGWDNKTF